MLVGRLRISGSIILIVLASHGEVRSGAREVAFQFTEQSLKRVEKIQVSRTEAGIPGNIG